MTTWHVLTDQRRTAHCPIALALRDEFTGADILGRVELALDHLDAGNAWLPTPRKPARTPGGVFVYTGLGRAVDPAILPSFRVRVRIEADYYRPAYRLADDGLEFDVPTYNDVVPPAVTPIIPEVVLMLPSAAYPFGGYIRVLHGRVLDAGGEPLADASVEADGVERVVTDDNGAFSLPLRWQAVDANVSVQVDHPRSGQSAAAAFSLPNDLIGNHDITVT